MGKWVSTCPACDDWTVESMMMLGYNSEVECLKKQRKKAKHMDVGNKAKTRSLSIVGWNGRKMVRT